MTTPTKATLWVDRFGRALHELRVSVTDRCNFRCRYCMPREHFGQSFHHVPREEILSYEDITRVISILRNAGLRKVRITGGEPLLRHDLDHLVRMLKQRPGLEVAMTTNGVLLPKYVHALRSAGLDRLTVSLDALDADIFHQTTDSRFNPADVLQGITAAKEAGFGAVSINCVLKRGLNDSQILPLVEYFRHSGHVLRFIEYMDTGHANGWSPNDVVTADRILEIVSSKYPIESMDRVSSSQTSQNFQFADGAGEIGIVASVSKPFCRHCTRARITAKGEIYTCLFGSSRLNVRDLILRGHSDAELTLALSQAWFTRDDHYSEIRTPPAVGASLPSGHPPILASNLIRGKIQLRPEMSYLGG